MVLAMNGEVEASFGLKDSLCLVWSGDVPYEKDSPALILRETSRVKGCDGMGMSKDAEPLSAILLRFSVRSEGGMLLLGFEAEYDSGKGSRSVVLDHKWCQQGT